MKDLIERLEKATGPDRELDVLIAAARDGATAEWQAYKNEFAFHRDGSWVSVHPLLPFTASIDAALTLVPDDERVIMGRHQTVGTRPWAQVGRPANGSDSTAPTPALALCIAALKARMTAASEARSREVG